MVMNGFVSDMRRLFVSGEWDGGRSRATVPTGGFMFLRLLVFCSVMYLIYTLSQKTSQYTASDLL